MQPTRARSIGIAVSVGLLALPGLGGGQGGSRPASAAPKEAVGASSGRTHATSAPQIQVDKSRVDLVNHRLELRLSHPPARVDIKVLSDAGDVLAEDSRDFTGAAAGAPLEIGWTPSSPAPAARIELVAHDTAGGFAGLAVFSWSLSIPHEEVVFNTGSSEILESERPKLEASLHAITHALATHRAEFGRPTLYIAGHTDTVGSDASNLELSRARAQAIGRWFRGHGVTIAIAYEGFGESALAVKTADEVDEARNRRADYILSVEPPALSGPGAGATVRPIWKRIS